MTFKHIRNPKGSDLPRKRPMTKRRSHIDDVNFAHSMVRNAMMATNAAGRMYWIGLAKSALNWVREGRVPYPGPIGANQ